MELSKTHKLIDDRFEEHLLRIQEFIKQPSISADGTGIKETASMVKSFIEELGGKADIILTKGHPIVYGELDQHAEKTLLIYGMYDVQPVENEIGLWKVDPFSGSIIELESLGKCMVSRGVYNTKGPLRAFFNACNSILDVKEKLPVNLIFVIEGEEELGSPNLPGFIEKFKDKLARADAMYFPMPSQNIKGKVIMELGVKGIIFMELICKGGKWGGPTKHGIHSSHASWVESPALRLISALTSMVKQDGTILIKGLYKNVRKPTEEEAELLKRLRETFDEEAIKEELKIERFRKGMKGFEALKSYLYEPSINIDGIISGHIGVGTKTVLPYEAKAKIDVRLVPNMEPEGTIERVKQHLVKHGYEDIEVKIHDCYTWSQVSVKENVVQAMISVYRFHGYEPEIWPRASGSAPFYLFNRYPLTMPYVVGGLGHAGNAHAPNEYFVLRGIRDFEKSVVTFLFKFASM